jgi:antitoxin VapB
MYIQVGPMRAVTKLFLSNRSQAVRIPAHLRLPDSVKEVEVRACGQERIIAPLGRSWDSFFQGGPTVPDDFLEERASQQQSERESF